MAAIRHPQPDLRLRTLAWGALAVVGAALMLLSLDFLYPRGAAPEKLVAAGPASAFAPGSATHFEREHFYLVRLPTGEFRAFYDLDPFQQRRSGLEVNGSACRLKWYAAEETPRSFEPHLREHPEGLFREPCHLSTFTISGERIYGPSPADLDQYRVKVVMDRVTVDLSKATCAFGPAGQRRGCTRPRRNY